MPRICKYDTKTRERKVGSRTLADHKARILQYLTCNDDKKKQQKNPRPRTVSSKHTQEPFYMNNTVQSSWRQRQRWLHKDKKGENSDMNDLVYVHEFRLKEVIR